MVQCFISVKAWKSIIYLSHCNVVTLYHHWQSVVCPMALRFWSHGGTSPPDRRILCNGFPSLNFDITTVHVFFYCIPIPESEPGPSLVSFHFT